MTLSDYERSGTPFRSGFSGRCTIDDDHLIRRDDLVVRVRLQENPFVHVPGVACKGCTIMLPKTKK